MQAINRNRISPGSRSRAVLEHQYGSVQCHSSAGMHTMAYQEWGDADNPDVVICLHSYTRLSNDFDALASELSAQFRVICPDFAGRGRSGWLRNPQDYHHVQYVDDIVTLLARLQIDSADFIGTGLGATVAARLAALPNSPVKKLILNDFTPQLEVATLKKVGQEAGLPWRFSRLEEAIQFIRSNAPSRGQHTEAQWLKFCTDVLRQNAEGMWIRHYDLNLALPLLATNAEMVQSAQLIMWWIYDAITCPTLLLRAADSEMLLKETAIDMTRRGPKPQLVEFEQVGTTATLVHSNQINVVKDFLLDRLDLG